MASKRTEYLLKRKQSLEEDVNLIMKLLQCEFRQLEAIPLYEFKEVKIMLEKMLKTAKERPEIYA